jgi:uncharacterized protein (TIGR02217 family)
MAILEQLIPTGVKRGSRGGPTTLREMVYDGAGQLKHQRFLRGYPLHRYRFDFGTNLLEDAEAIRDFFYVVMFSSPPYEGFLVRDWNDYELTQANSVLSFVSGSDWQINRAYSVGVAQVLRAIYKLEENSVTVYRTRAAAVSEATATIDETTGLATISGHMSGDTYTCTGRFNIPVTFATDDAFANVALDGNVDAILQELGDIELVELPPP